MSLLSEEEREAVLIAKSKELSTLLNENLPEGTGFALMLFEFGDHGNFAWISNADRVDMMAALREFIAKASH